MSRLVGETQTQTLGVQVPHPVYGNEETRGYITCTGPTEEREDIVPHWDAQAGAPERDPVTLS